MNLTEVNVGEEYIVKEIQTDDEEMDAFLLHWDAIVENRLL